MDLLTVLYIRETIITLKIQNIFITLKRFPVPLFSLYYFLLQWNIGNMKFNILTIF